MKAVSAFLGLLALAGLAIAAGSPPPPPPAGPPAPGLQYLYRVNITAGQVFPIGAGPLGQRLVVTIAGGTFAGPKLKGKVVAAGGDWALIDRNGSAHIDVRQTFQTDDGAFIQVFETGIGLPDGVTGYLRLGFETGSEKYNWINNIVGVGILNVLNDTHISIDAWQLTLPGAHPPP